MPHIGDFSTAEFENRLLKAQDLMAQQKIDLLLLNSEPEVRYFSGFRTLFWQSPTRPWFLLLPQIGKPVSVIPSIGEQLMQSTWIDDIRTWFSPNPEDEGISLLHATIEELTNQHARIGMMCGHETQLRMPLNDLKKLQNLLPSSEWVDCTQLIRTLRMIKSEAEIEKIKTICTIANDAFDAINFQVGQPLDEVFRSFKITLLEKGAEDVPYLVGSANQGGYSDVISPPNNRPLEKGDVLMLDTGSTRHGYFCDFDRNYALLSANKKAHHMYQVLYNATEAGIAAAKVGNRCCDVFTAMAKIIEKHGGDCKVIGRLGHGLGMQLTEWPSHTSTDTTVIEENMVLTIEPSIEISPGKMMVHEENIVIRPEGAELLSRRAPCELPIIGN